MTARPYHHGNLRTHLVEVTRELLESEGPHSVTVNAVAKAAGVSVAAPYRHFSDKRALLDAVATDGFQQLRSALAAAAEREADPVERLVAAGVAYIEFATAHPHLFHLMFNADLRPAQAKAGPEALAALAELVGAIDLSVPADVAVRTAWALAHGLATLRIGGMRTFTDADSHAQLRAELSVLFTGIHADQGR